MFSYLQEPSLGQLNKCLCVYVIGLSQHQGGHTTSPQRCKIPMSVRHRPRVHEAMYGRGRAEQKHAMTLQEIKSNEESLVVWNRVICSSYGHMSLQRRTGGL